MYKVPDDVHSGGMRFLDSVNTVGWRDETVVRYFGKAAAVLAGKSHRHHLSVPGRLERAALANDFIAKAFRRFVDCSVNLIGRAHIIVQRSLFSVRRSTFTVWTEALPFETCSVGSRGSASLPCACPGSRRSASLTLRRIASTVTTH